MDTRLYGLCLFFFWSITALLTGEPAPQGLLAQINPYWSLLWTGSWEHEKALINRGDLRLHLPWQHLSLRVQLMDKRSADFETGITAFSGGLYHEKTNSRLLYGILDEGGLPARLRSPWSRSVPFAEYHKPSISDLKTEPASSKEPAVYLYLESPLWGKWKGFTSVLLDHALSPGITSGFELQFRKKTNFRLEGFYTGKELPPRTAGSWFSESPPLPERDFRLYGVGLGYASPFLGVTSDWGYSDTFAYGRDFYGNLGIRLGNRPWQGSIAIDGGGSRFVGRDGSAPGAGFRLGARLEYHGKKTQLFRFSTVFRGAGLGQPFDRSSTLIYYRFPVNFGRLPLKPSGISLNLSRNASNPGRIEDKAEAGMSLNWGPFRSVSSGTWTGFSAPEAQPFPFPIPEDTLEFGSLHIAEEISCNFRVFQFRVKWGATIKQDTEPVWDALFYGGIRGKPGRLSLSISSPEFPAKWTYTISWRMQKK